MSPAKYPAVIALPAILMMFIAPVLSRHLQSQRTHLLPAFAGGGMRNIAAGLYRSLPVYFLPVNFDVITRK
ncbi:hypothetical protein GTPT_0986 [Tatumella ptyseos ATCC 33301]|uniref:Uncharacterized protein n=1 Tax=Tatumella ptyseos ATCC 33301 TaxID=1005995 RepID=A0A085JKQ1_9GAMM|nr:hypothetical protein GTPT_0986 [Tatumella ptyseos ATCC 33301]